MFRQPVCCHDEIDVGRLVAATARVDDAKAALEADDVAPFAAQALKRADLLAGLKARLRDREPQATTNAWIKMYEMAHELDLLRDRPRVFLNAELPGGFVAALHHLADSRGFELDWRASSLVDGGTGRADGALGDSYGLMAGSPDRWIVDPPDFCGDLRTEVDELVRRAGGQFGLVTSDAGVDIGREFHRQEELNLPVHRGQVEAALRLTEPGGTAVVKTYSVSLPESVDLLVQFARGFRTMEIVKPASSRPSNSEVYLVGRGRGEAPSAAGQPLHLAMEAMADHQVSSLEWVAQLARFPRRYNTKLMANDAQDDWIARHPVGRLGHPLPGWPTRTKRPRQDRPSHAPRDRV